ncbi:hypothetical protein ACS0PU_007884 [Formica fusca]
MAINIDIPSINGAIEAGITIGVDSSLPEDKKLPILMQGVAPAALAVVKQHAALWAYVQFTDATARRLFVNGVLGVIDTGLIYAVQDLPDGDWVKANVAQQATAVQKQAIEGIVVRDDMLKAVTVAVATKANFWLMNHHTGQGQVAGYVKKVLDVFYPNAVNDQVVSAAYNLGHFTSTLRVLGLAEIAGLKVSVPFVRAEGASITLSADSKLRFTSMPAGTHRLAIAYEAAKRLVRSVYGVYCPAVEDFAAIPELRARIIEASARYHIGASYLTGEARADYQDTDMNNYLGRLGTFISTLYRQSTLAKSPHLVIARVESYDDYDADFKALLGRIQVAQAAARGRMVEAQIEEFAGAAADVMGRLRNAYAIPARR